MGFFLFLVCAMPWIVFMFMKESSTIYLIINIVNFNLIVALLAFSIYRIRKYSKMLVQSNIFANECLMLSHLASFTWLTLLITIGNSLTLSNTGWDSEEDMTIEQLRISYAITIISYLQVTGCLAVVITMMIMFVKHSTVLSKSKEQEITNRFMLVFTGINDLDKINEARLKQHDEQVERDRETKKMKIYRQMANV